MVSCLCPYRHLVKAVRLGVLVFAVLVAAARVARALPVAAAVEHAVVAGAVVLQRVRRAAVVALVAPDVQLVLHEPDVRLAQRAAAGVAVAQPREAVDAVRLHAVVPRLAAVPLFVLPWRVVLPASCW